MPIATYSPAYTIVPTYECFNRCSYCNFRIDPGQGRATSLATAQTVLSNLPSEVIEILILSGEIHPQSHQRRSWFAHIYALCELAIQTGFLPHTNAGILTREEMQQLKTVNVSMGLMLEQITPKLLTTVHRHAPSKVPARRYEQLVWAGQLQIPFTTGLRIGLGETRTDWQATLDAIAHCHNDWGHIQEVIIQPYCPGSREQHQGWGCPPQELVTCVQMARQILPSEIAIQIPPNLVVDIAPHRQARSTPLLACLEAGATDLGGIGPVDEVNPDYPHHQVQNLRSAIAPEWQLKPRLPIYPQYENWLSPQLKQAVDAVKNKRLSR
jgi:FO synthase subunit 1